MRYRHENFGGIVSSEDPPFLAFVDRAFMRKIGAKESPVWETADESIGTLSAPTEVHFACTNRCNANCPHCYMDSGTADQSEMNTDEFKKALEYLSRMGVFHVALGGGEALLREDLFDIATFARQVGLVPNLTTSGIGLTEELAAKMKVFGQVNLSLDGVGELSGIFRGRDISDDVDRALLMLRMSEIRAGLNCVLGRGNFDGIVELFEYAKKRGVNEIEFLRLKPSGRAEDMYDDQKMTYEQNLQLLPTLTACTEGYEIVPKIDCSFIPMLCCHNPPRDLLNAMATYGCEAGNVLIGARSDGTVSGCSFLPDKGIKVMDLKEAWIAHPELERMRSWTKHAPEPCLSCEYLDICKGGCHAVAEKTSGSNFSDPDPDCPKVVEYKAAEKS